MSTFEHCEKVMISQLYSVSKKITKNQSWFHPILVNGNQLEVVRSAKLLASDLPWNEHVNETVKKASIKMFVFKRARFRCRDLVLFYATCIR